jgi:hypothetical protein
MIPHYNIFPPGYAGQFYPPYPPISLPSLFYPPSFYPSCLPHQDSDPTRPRGDRGLQPWTPIPKLYPQLLPDRPYNFYQDSSENAITRLGESYKSEEDYYREKCRDIDRRRQERSNSGEMRRDKRRGSNSIDRRRDRSDSLDRRRDRSNSIDRRRRKRSDSRERDSRERFRDLRRDRSYSRERDRFRDLRRDRSNSRETSRNLWEERYSKERNRSRDRYVDTRDDRQIQDQKNKGDKPEKLNTKKLDMKVVRSSSKKSLPSPIPVVSSPESISTSTSKHSPVIPQDLSKPNPHLRSLTTSPKPKPTLPKAVDKPDTPTYPKPKQISPNAVHKSDSQYRHNPNQKATQSTNISLSTASKNHAKSFQNVSKSSSKSEPKLPFSSKPLLPDPPTSDFKLNQIPKLPKAKFLNKTMEKKLLNLKSLLEFGEEFLSMSNLKYRYHQVPSTPVVQILHNPSDAVLGEGRSSRAEKAKMQAIFRVLAGYNSELLERWLDKQVPSLSF